MKVCYFGIYDPDYARNQVLIMGLKENGVAVTQCRVDPKKYAGLGKYWQLCRLGLKAKRQEQFDFIIVGFPGQSVYWIAYLLWGKKAILDMFLSLYDTNVLDRRLYSTWTVRGMRDWLYDWYSVRLAAHVLLDTQEHVKYIARLFSVVEKKFIRVPVSANTEIFKPMPMLSHENFIVGFTGMFAPLHGAEYIIQAAELLRNYADIRFILVGSGQDEKKIRKLVSDLGLEKTVTIHASVAQEKLPDYIAGFDVCLGIFSDSKKATRVIPNKFYQYAAMQKVIITANSPALHELFKEGEQYIGCRSANADDLAEKVLSLYANKTRRDKIAQNAHSYFYSKLQPKMIARELITTLSKHEV